MPIEYWLPFVFVLGAAIGSFLNVCIYRLPREKSIIWPSSRCGKCLQAIAWYDNIPLVSYWLLHGRCRSCGVRFSWRYFGVELLTALGFAGLFYLEVIDNVHHLNAETLGAVRFNMARLVIFGYHAVLFCFLLVAVFCDIDQRLIPLSITVTGTIVGLLGSVVFPWPWPYFPEEAVMPPGPWWLIRETPKPGLYPWPVWGPLPVFLQPGGNWRTGLATGLAGLAMGTGLLRMIRLTFGLGMGAKYMEDADPEEHQVWLLRRWWLKLSRVGGKALGLGDADLMMMVGSFLGWQMVMVAFFIAVFPGMLFGLVQRYWYGDNLMPFGPSLACGTIITWLGWSWIAPSTQMLFFFGNLLGIMVVVSSVLMLVAGYTLRLVKLLRD